MWIYLFYILLFIVIVCMTKDIICTVCFIRPMRKKYDILVDDISKNINGKYMFLILEIILIFLYFRGIYFENIIFSIIILIVYAIITSYYIYKHKKYDILNYIDTYSYDLFNWDKIYELRIDEDLKKQCFSIHNIEYEAYKETYLSNLQLKQNILKLQIDKLETTAQKYKNRKDN